jgi:hypothetical protein
MESSSQEELRSSQRWDREGSKSKRSAVRGTLPSLELELEAKRKGGSWPLKSPSGLQQKEKKKKRERMERREKKKTALVE